MKLACQFRIEDICLRCKTPVLITEDNESYTWMSPFSMDGLRPNSTLNIEFLIVTEHKHTVSVFNVDVRLDQLSFKQPRTRYLLKHKRFSIHNTSKLPTNEEQINCIHVNGVDISYVADKYDELIRLKITSLLARIPREKIEAFTGRTKIRMTLQLNGELFLYKANTVFTQDNGTKLFSWIFDPNSSMVQNNVRIDNREVYDCDLDNGDENNCKRVYTPQVVDDTILLEFTRDVFFPTGETGYAPKHLSIRLSKLDFSARRDTVLERGLRLGIALKMHFDKEELYLYRIDLLVDDFPHTVETHFLSETTYK